MRLEYRIGYTFEDRFTSKYKVFQNAFQKGLKDIEKGFGKIDRELKTTFQNVGARRGYITRVGEQIHLISSEAFQQAVEDWRKDYKDFGRDLQRKPLEVPAKLDIDDREIKQMEDRSFNLTVFPVISSAKSVVEEEAVTLTDALYEGVRYGLRKADLAKAFAEELRKAGGYIGTEEIAQSFVRLTEMGVRGTAKEMAEFASMVTRVSKATKLSSEGVAQLTYEMQGLGLSVKDMQKVFAYAGGAMEKYNLTQDKVIEGLQAFKETGGAVFASLSADARGKLLKGMIDLSGKLESLYLDSVAFTRQIGALMSGRFEEARGLMALLGSQAQEFRKALESGDVQKAQQMLMGRLLELRERLATIPPQLRGYYIQQYSELYQIPVDTLTQLVNKSSGEIRQVFAESVSPVDIDERMKETTNVITKWTNVIKNKIVGTFGAEFADVIGEGIDTVTQVGGMVAPFLLFKALPYIGGKIGGKALGTLGGVARGFPFFKVSLPKFEAPKAASILSTGKTAASEIAEVTSKGSGLLSKAGKLAKLAKLAKFGKIGGALTLLSTGIEFATAKTAKEKAEAVGGGAGGLTGALAGAAIGSAILPGIGTVIGGILGGLGGDFIGRKVVGAVSSLFGGEEERVKEIKQVSKEREVQREKETIKEGRSQDEVAILMAIATKLDVLAEVRDLLSAYLTQQKLKPSPKPVYTGMEDWIDKGFKR